MASTLTARPASDWYLAQCRALANHVIVLDGDRVVFCGTDRARAAKYAACVADDRLSVEHTSGRDSRAVPPAAAPRVSPVTGEPAPHGLDGFGRPAGRPMSKSDQRAITACAASILLSPIMAAVITAIA